MHVFQIDAGEVVPLAFHDDLLSQGLLPTDCENKSGRGKQAGLRDNKKIGEL